MVWDGMCDMVCRHGGADPEGFEPDLLLPGGLGRGVSQGHREPGPAAVLQVGWSVGQLERVGLVM